MSILYIHMYLSMTLIVPHAQKGAAAKVSKKQEAKLHRTESLIRVCTVMRSKIKIQAGSNS